MKWRGWTLNHLETQVLSHPCCMLLPPSCFAGGGLESDIHTPPLLTVISDTSSAVLPQIHSTSERFWRQLGPGQGESEAGLGPARRQGEDRTAQSGEGAQVGLPTLKAVTSIYNLFLQKSGPFLYFMGSQCQLTIGY